MGFVLPCRAIYLTTYLNKLCDLQTSDLPIYDA